MRENVGDALVWNSFTRLFSNRSQNTFITKWITFSLFHKKTESIFNKIFFLKKKSLKVSKIHIIWVSEHRIQNKYTLTYYTINYLEIKTKFSMWSYILKTYFKWMVFSQLEQGLNLMQEIYLIMPYKRIVLASKDDFFSQVLDWYRWWKHRILKFWKPSTFHNTST